MRKALRAAPAALIAVAWWPTPPWRRGPTASRRPCAICSGSRRAGMRSTSDLRQAPLFADLTCDDVVLGLATAVQDPCTC